MNLERDAKRESPPLSADDREISELMSGAMTDPGFSQFLGEEFRDLDRVVAPLVYALWKKQVILTRWSCSGHTDRSHADAGFATTPGMFVYARSYLLYQDIRSERSEKFLSLFGKVFAHIPSVATRRVDPKMPNAMNQIVITMDDIVTTRETPKSNLYHTLPAKEIPEEQARERMRQIYNCWKQLALEVNREF